MKTYQFAIKFFDDDDTLVAEECRAVDADDFHLAMEAVTDWALDNEEEFGAAYSEVY